MPPPSSPDFIPAEPDFIPAEAQPKPEPLAPLSVTPQVANDMWKAGVHAKMLGITPGQAYDAKDEISKQLSERGGNYDDGKLDDTFANDIKVGLEGSIFGLHHREKLPDEVKNPGLIDRFTTGLATMVADLPFYVAGGAGGAVAGSEVPIVGNVIGGAAGAFAVPAGVREALMQGIKHGEVKDFSDLLRRAGAVTWEATKGAVVGAATEAAGGLPVGSLIGKSAVATIGVKGLYQATALTTAADVLEGHLPTAQDFAGNAALIVPLNLITHGIPMLHPEAKQATLDVYAKDGTTPQETTQRLTAQPPVKPDLPEGLRPAIQTGDGHVEGDPPESHADLSERVLGKRAVSLDALEKDPAKADRVLENPTIHEQDVIDRAWQLKKEAIEAEGVPDEDKARSMAEQQAEQEELAAERKAAGEDPGEPTPPKEPQTIDELYERSSMKSGRGFTTPDGQFLSRMEARKWMKDNEPDAHAVWLEEQGGDKQAELHSQAYAEARNRVQARNVAEGDPTIANVSPENAQRLGAAREGLNKIKAGTESTGYGKEVLRTLFAGQRDTRVAATTQLRDELKKIIPDYHDQEALSILRDYKGTPDKLTADLERIHSSGTEREKALIPSIERAINPSPALQEADAKLTDYYAKALDEGRQLGFLESGIDPANYSPHILTRILDGEKPSGSGKGSVMTTRTPYAEARSYPTILDALKTGTLDARTVNALDALSVYGDRHATVVATKLLATELKNTELGKYGTADKHPDGWVELAPGQGAFRNTRAITDADGESHVVSQSLYVPKDVADAMKPLFESGLAGTDYAPLLKAQGYVKALELGLSFFHMKALTITAFNNMGIADFTRSLKADLASPEFASAERGWAADGLTTSKTQTPYEAYKGLDKSSIPTGLDKLANAPVIKQVDAAFQAITRETFDVIQRKFKVQDASLKQASWMAKHPEAFATPEPAKGMTRLYHGGTDADPNGDAWYSSKKDYAEGYAKKSLGGKVYYVDVPTSKVDALVDPDGYGQTVANGFTFTGELPVSETGPRKLLSNGDNEAYFAARRSIAKEVNSAYGGLNWDVLGRGKTFRDVSRLFLLAPDWTFSNVLTAKYAFEGGPAGSAAREFWVKSFATGFALTAAASIAIGGKYDPTDIKHIDQVYLGTDEKGKEMYANWFFAGAPKDAITLAKRAASDSPIAGTAEFIVSKASPALGLLGDVAYNKKGGSNIPVRDTKDSTLEQTGETLKYAAGRVVPITGVSAVKTVSDALTDPNHEYSYQDLLSLAADALGSPATHTGTGGGAGGGESSTSRFQRAGRGEKSRFSIRSRK